MDKGKMSPWVIMDTSVHSRHEFGKITGLENRISHLLVSSSNRPV